MSKEIEELIGIAIGEASMCWKETPKGEFDSIKAERIVMDLIKEIRAIKQPEPHLSETEMIQATKEFAEAHSYPFDSRIESMVLNAYRHGRGESVDKKMLEALKGIESACDNQNESHEFIWRIAYEAIQSAEQQLEKEDGWISVEDRLPKDNQKVLITNNDTIVISEYLQKQFYVFEIQDTLEIDEISHWMPLPNPPKQK